MRTLAILRLRLRSLFSRSRVESELDEELRYHLQRQIEEDIAAGILAADARCAAMRDFAGFEQRKEECRDMRGLNMIDDCLQDLRFAIRQLGKYPGFTTTAILMLAMGLCASVAIFAFVDAALIKPLPYPNASQLVGVYETNIHISRSNLSYLDYLDWKKLNKVFASLEAYRNSGFILTAPTGAQAARGARVSAGFFRALGVAPAIGRDFHTGEDLPGAPRTVLLSDAAWQARYGGKTDVVGKTVTLDSLPYVVIGVLPRNFHFAPVGTPEYWAPLDGDNPCERRRSCHNMWGVARLNDGVSVQTAVAGVTLIAQQLEKLYPASNRGQGANVVPLTELIVGDIRPILLVLLGGAGLLLVIVCVNVTSLLLVRSESRHRELAVRSALGASRARLFRQFVTEGLLLVATGSALGLVSAEWTMRLLMRLIPAGMMMRMPFLHDLGLNARVSAFAFAIALFAAALFAVIPTLRLSFTELREGLAEGSRGTAGNTWRRLGSKLVVVELATAMVLLVGAGLLGQSLYRLLHVDLGFQPDHLATLMVGGPDANKSNDKAIAFGRQVVSTVSSLPGVNSVGLTSLLPVSGNGNTAWVRFVGHPYNGEHNEVNQRDVSSEYLKTIGARLLRGRYFTDAEDASKPAVVIINETLARKYFPNEDPIGQQIGNADLAPNSIQTIVGVVEDVREAALDAEIWPAEYVPFNQSADTYFSLIVRTSQSELSVLPALADVIRQVNAGAVTRDAGGMRQRIEDSPSAYIRRSSAWLVGAFAAVALLLGVIGLYGVTAYSVSRRTREIGVRMALGAERSTVCRLVLKEAGWLTATGIILGAMGSLGAASLMGKLLFRVRSWDVPTLLVVAAVLSVAALLASYFPARRAASVNPVDALRAD